MENPVNLRRTYILLSLAIYGMVALSPLPADIAVVGPRTNLSLTLTIPGSDDSPDPTIENPNIDMVEITLFITPDSPASAAVIDDAHMQNYWLVIEAPQGAPLYINLTAKGFATNSTNWWSVYITDQSAIPAVLREIKLEIIGGIQTAFPLTSVPYHPNMTTDTENWSIRLQHKIDDEYHDSFEYPALFTVQCRTYTWNEDDTRFDPLTEDDPDNPAAEVSTPSEHPGPPWIPGIQTAGGSAVLVSAGPRADPALTLTIPGSDDSPEPAEENPDIDMIEITLFFSPDTPENAGVIDDTHLADYWLLIEPPLGELCRVSLTAEAFAANSTNWWSVHITDRSTIPTVLREIRFEIIGGIHTAFPLTTVPHHPNMTRDTEDWGVRLQRKTGTEYLNCFEKPVNVVAQCRSYTWNEDESRFDPLSEGAPDNPVAAIEVVTSGCEPIPPRKPSGLRVEGVSALLHNIGYRKHY